MCTLLQTHIPWYLSHLCFGQHETHSILVKHFKQWLDINEIRYVLIAVAEPIVPSWPRMDLSGLFRLCWQYLLVILLKQQEVKVSSAAPGSLQHTLEERVAMYKMALQNAKTAGETSKARRYDRGLKVSKMPSDVRTRCRITAIFLSIIIVCHC